MYLGTENGMLKRAFFLSAESWIIGLGLKVSM